MNSSGIIPPREGVQNLAAARKALSGQEVSSSHITDSIIKTHSALEALFRQYLSEMAFVPSEVRSRAVDHFGTSFPELVRAMSAYGKPSLSEAESEVLNLNQVRNQHAHGQLTMRVTPRVALSYVELAEETYSKYSQFNLRRGYTNPMKGDNMNPFIKELQKAHWFSSYSSDDNYRIVWLRGQNAKVPEKGSFRCPIRKFDTVAYVWMNAVQLPIDLSGVDFLSLDNVNVGVQMELTVKVQDAEQALITVATRFDDSVAILKGDAITVVQEILRKERAAKIPGLEAELALEVREAMVSGNSNSTFNVLKALVHLHVPIIEHAANQEIISTIDHEQAERKEVREAALSQIRSSRSLAELKANLEQEKNRIEAECQREQAKAESNLKTETARLEYLKSVAALTDASKTAILHIAPDIYRDLELAKISNSTDQRERSRAEIMELLKCLAEISKNATPVTSVLGANISNSK